MAISQSLLYEKSKSFSKSIFTESKKQASYKRVKSAFLCHSHKDRTLVLGLLSLFQELGIDLYIDWQDHSMPEVPNRDTALKIQNKIKSSDLFIFLASQNSKTSRWCPWEIGYADSSNRPIYLLPTSDGRDSYGNEYLQLYPRIDNGELGANKGFAVFQPSQSTGVWLTESVFS